MKDEARERGERFNHEWTRRCTNFYVVEAGGIGLDGGMMKLRNGLIGLFACGFSLLGISSMPAGIELEDGDTFVFLGDSITHQCLYTQYIENFFYTRYPERRIHFHNSGVSGDKAGDALARFEEDVAAFKPKYVSVLLGMNDGTYADYDSEIFGIYEKGMTEILDRIEGMDAEPVLMTPTMFDHYQLAIRMQDPTYRFKDRERSPNYNALMAFYGAWVREQAIQRRRPFVNLWGPLNDLTVEMREAEPGFTFITDSIHPVPGGQFVMAFSVLSQLTPERKAVSSIAIVRKGEKWIAGKASGVSDLEGGADGISFTHTAVALPWVVPEAASEADLRHGMEPSARMAYELTKAGHKMSNERMKVAGLTPGSYEVTIDGKSIGKAVSHVQLGTKIELQANENTPQFQQALKVAMLNRERNDKAVRPLRDLWGRMKGARRKLAAGGDEAGFETAVAALRPQIADMIALAKDYEDKIYAANQPVPRKYVVRKVK